MSAAGWTIGEKNILSKFVSGIEVMDELVSCLTLVFVCPASGEEVSTGVEMDTPTLSQLELAKIYCPHCQRPHHMFGVEYWLSHTDMPITEAA